MSEINNTLILYAVRNSQGQYFKAKGYSGSGASWVDDINKARIYGRTGGARGTITWFATNHPKYPTPDLIKLTVTGIEVMDETKRVEKAKQKKATEEANRIKRQAENQLKDAERKLAEAQATIKKLKNK
jgi:hypothetical protein